MTTIVKDTAAKFAVAAVAVAMIFSAYAPAAQAQTTEDLQQMINDLLAQVSGLQSQLGQGSTGDSMGSSSDVCPYTWTRDLNMGSEGADVMKLQQFLNANADTRVAATGAGSAGNETMYYGPATGAAVSKFQVMYRAEVLTPAGLVNPTTYFGPSTRAKANMLCASAPEMEEEEEGEEMEEEEEETGDNSPLSEGGDLVTFEVDDEETEVTEGEEDAPVLALTLEAEDGDVSVSRMTFSLVEGGDAPANGEDEPWEVFEEVSLWVDGDKVASFEADDEDNYLDEDAGTFRFTGLDMILREDEETEVLVAVSVMNSVDDSDVADGADWTIDVTSVRYMDGEDVTTTSTDVDEVNNAGFDFDVEEEGTDDGADLESNSDNPEAANLLVDEDTDESDEFTVHLFDIEVDNESGDLEVGDVFVDVTVADITGGAGIAGGQEDVIDGIFMTIDGETVEGEATTNGTNNEDDAIAGAGSSEVEYLFEFDQDVVLEGDTDYEVEITMIFEGQDGNYVNGVTVMTAVDGSTWEVEGSASDNELTGTDSSEAHTLATVIPVISDNSFTVDRNEDGDAGTISYEFTMEADGENDINFVFGDVAAVDGSADDVRFTLSGADITIASAAISKVGGDATVTGTTGWTINDGDSADFVLDVTFTTVDAADDGTYRVTLDTIEGLEIDETSEGMSLNF